jgi:hypothetical protein
MPSDLSRQGAHLKVRPYMIYRFSDCHGTLRPAMTSD